MNCGLLKIQQGPGRAYYRRLSIFNSTNITTNIETAVLSNLSLTPQTEDESGDQNAEPESEPDKVPDSVENQFESAHRSGGEGVEAGPTQEVEDSRRIMGSSVTKVWQGRNR